jgi:hypothetical protein
MTIPLSDLPPELRAGFRKAALDPDPMALTRFMAEHDVSLKRGEGRAPAARWWRGRAAFDWNREDDL